MGKRKTYSTEYKANAVELVKSGRSVSLIAKELGVTETSIRRWVEASNPPALDKDARIAELETRIKRLETELKDKDEESKILKKAFGIFVKP